jgi:hypothetical protein
MRSRQIRSAVAFVAAFAAMAATPAAAAERLADAAIYFEINDTDGDAGVQVFLDGEGWDTMRMIGPNGVEFSVMAEGGVGQQGITEFFFESAEPSFEEQPLEELLALFPRGFYRFEGTTTDGRLLRGKARLTHVLPGAPLLLFPTEADIVDPDNALFMWAPVAYPPGSEIEIYQVVVACEEPGSKLAVDVPATVTELVVPPQILTGQDECKWEVLAVESSGNRTISEGEFEVE